MRPIAAITGASSGIGEVFARRLAATHDLILIARRRDRLEGLARELPAEVLEADLSIAADIDRVAQRIGCEPRLDLLINNAGFGTKGLFWKTQLASQQAMHDVHVTATMRLTHAALAGMVARDRGAVINVASIASFVRSPGNVSYGATKAYLAAFTEALTLELRATQSRVKVQALCPGLTYSEFHSTLGVDRAHMGPKWVWMSAAEVVDASLRGLDKGKLFVVPGWINKVIVGVLPRLPAATRVAIEGFATRARSRRLIEKDHRT